MPSSTDIPAITARGLVHSFGDVRAVDGVDLDVEKGAVFGLLGPDGAGKSTLIRMLASVLAPDEGHAEIFGADVSDRRAVVGRIGYMSQRFSMYPDLTVAENVEFFGRLRGVPAAVRRQRAGDLLEGMGLRDFADRQAQYLSGGMKQKLMLASTLVHEPDMLLLDEPTTGVDPVSRREFWRIIGGLKRRGKTVLVATPYMDEAERCTHIAFMDAGRFRVCGTPDDVRALVPGRLLEAQAAHPYPLRDAAVGIAGVLSSRLLGDVVRILLADDGPDDATLLDALRQATGEDVTLRPVRIDMDAVYAFLAEEGGS